MHSPFDVLIFNTKLVTAALLVLNFLLLASLFLAVKWARSPQSTKERFGRREQTYVFGMLMGVILLNAFAVYGNNSLRGATDDLINGFAGLETQAAPPAQEAPAAPDQDQEGKPEPKEDPFVVTKNF